MEKLISVVLSFFRNALLKTPKPVVFSTKEGALRGYDPVCYFKIGRPEKGNTNYTYLYQDSAWHFTSAENLSIFKEDPERFVPQFGGYCAFGMSRGYKAEIQPDAWTIVDGKLYLNYSLDILAKWRARQTELIEKANKNWPTVKTK